MSVDVATRMALERTYLAHERTLMAWVRTSTSLMTFGFTIYKFFEYYLEASGERRLIDSLFGPRQFAMWMIGIGLVALGLACVEHWRALDDLKRARAVVPRYSLSALLSVLMVILGSVALATVIFRF